MKTLTEYEKNKKYPLRLAKFKEGWMDMEPALPVPKIDWINEKILDVAFGDDPKQKLDIYYPNIKKEKYPILIIILGGGWSHMDKADWHLYPGFFFLESGFMVISVNYRLAPANKFPNGFDDVNTALETIIKNSSEWKVDLKNVFFWGASAGANFCTMLGLKYGSDTRIRIGGVASLCPVLDFGPQIQGIKKHHLGDAKPKWLFHILVPFLLKKMLKDYVGYMPNFKKSPVNPFDSTYYIGKKIPPFYFQYGYKDPLIISTLVEDFAAKLIESGADPKDIACECMPDAPHMGATHHYFDEDKIRHYLEFFQARLIKEEKKKEECALIVRSDDAGSSLSANEAINKVLRNGIAKNCSIMSPSKYVKEFYELTKDIKDVNYGLHVTINSEWDKVKWGPITKLDKESGLVDDNLMFLADPKQFIETKPKIEVIIAEIEAQLSNLESIGFKISYLDTHMLPELYIEGLSDALSKFCLEHKLIDHKYYYKLYDFGKVLTGELPVPEGQYFFISHPSLDTDEMREVGNASVDGKEVASSRAKETELLSSVETKETLKAAGIKTIRYSDAKPYDYNTIEEIKKISK